MAQAPFSVAHHQLNLYQPRGLNNCIFFSSFPNAVIRRRLNCVVPWNCCLVVVIIGMYCPVMFFLSCIFFYFFLNSAFPVTYLLTTVFNLLYEPLCIGALLTCSCDMQMSKSCPHVWRQLWVLWGCRGCSDTAKTWIFQFGRETDWPVFS